MHRAKVGFYVPYFFTRRFYHGNADWILSGIGSRSFACALRRERKHERNRRGIIGDRRYKSYDISRNT